MCDESTIPRPFSSCVVCAGNQWIPLRTGRNLNGNASGAVFALTRCTLCGHIALNPPPTDIDLQGAYSSEYAPYRIGWKQTTWPLWRIIRELTTQRRIRRLKMYSTGRRLLEVGSGAGDFLYAASQAGWDVSAVEYNRSLAETLRNELGLDVREGELTEGLWDTEQFDVIVLWSVLEHVRDPRKTLRIAAQYLRAGGTVFMQLPTCYGAELGKSFGEYWELLEIPRHLNFFGRDGLTNVCKACGLELTLFRTPLLDSAWCYLASSGNYAKGRKSAIGQRLQLGACTAMAFFLLPWIALNAWRSNGTEAFAIAVKR